MAESQVSLAVLIYFGRIFTVFFSLFEGYFLNRHRYSQFLAGLLLYKGLTLPFEVERLVTDSVCLIAFLGVDLIRLSVADSGNKAGNYSFNLILAINYILAARSPIGLSLALTVPAVLLSVYFYQWQTYVLSIEQTIVIMYWTIAGIQILPKFIGLGIYN